MRHLIYAEDVETEMSEERFEREKADTAFAPCKQDLEAEEASLKTPRAKSVSSPGQAS